MRKKKQLKKFADWFCAMCDLPRIKIKFINARALRAPSGDFCFGCYEYDKKLNTPGTIYISYDLPKSACITILCHELVHLYQHVHTGLSERGIEGIESEAEKSIDPILAMWKAIVASKKSSKQCSSFLFSESIQEKHVNNIHPLISDENTIAPCLATSLYQCVDQCV